MELPKYKVVPSTLRAGVAATAAEVYGNGKAGAMPLVCAAYTVKSLVVKNIISCDGVPSTPNTTADAMVDGKHKEYST